MNDLPEGFALRHPTAEDLPAVQRLLDACESADCDEARTCDIDVAADALDPGTDPQHDWWLVTDGAGALAGYAALYWPPTCEARASVWVHPERRGLGLSQRLTEALEGRARELAARAPAGSTPASFQFCEDTRLDLQSWLLARGYERVREFYAMRVDLSGGAAAPPLWPPCLTIRDLRPHVDDEAVWAADLEAFEEHFLSFQMQFDDWQSWIYAHEGLDFRLWPVAWDGDQVAGMTLAVPRGDAAYVAVVLVRKPWRGRGLAKALLLEVFARLHERGFDDVYLHVDAENATGAVRLYAAVGMHVWRHYGVFRLEL